MGKIFDIYSLPKILDLIHDQYIDIDTLVYKSNNLEVDLKREDIDSSDYKITRRFLFFKRINYPIIFSKMIFKGVSSYNIIDDHGIGIYSIKDYTLQDQRLILNFCEVTRLCIDFENEIIIEVHDIGKFDEYGPI
jgi:hypothetical protein